TTLIPDDQADKAMQDKLKAELPGILAWCVRGCLDWQRTGLGEPPEVTQATAGYKKESDVIGQFLDEETERDPTGVSRVKASVMRERFHKWAGSSGVSVQPMTPTQFGIAMTNQGIQRIPSNGTYYVGIRLFEHS